MRVVVGIPTLGGNLSTLSRVLDAVRHQSLRPSLIVLCFPKDCEIAKSFAQDVTVLYSKKRGTSSQRNAILDFAGAQADVLQFLDDDVVLNPSYLDRACQAIVSLELAGATGLLRFDGEGAQHPSFGVRFLRRLALASNQSGEVTRSGINALPPRGETVSTFVSWLPGGLMAIRMASAQGLRFAEGLEDGPTKGYAMAEDVHFSMALAGRGRLGKVWTNEALHVGDESWKPKAAAYWEMKVWSRMYLSREFPERVTPWAVRYSTLCEVMIRAIELRGQERKAAVVGLIRGLFRSGN